jgi:hypothetical protein
VAQVLGRATVKFNGRVMLTDKGAKLNLGGVNRKEVVGDQVHGYAEEAVAPFIDSVISITKDTSLEDIQAVTNGTVTYEADTGQVWVLKNAWSSVPPEITAGEGGKVPVKWIGMSCERM